MAKFRIKSPAGDTYEITAPDDASEADVLSYARSQFEKPSGSSLDQALGKIDKMGAQQAAPSEQVRLHETIGIPPALIHPITSVADAITTLRDKQGPQYLAQQLKKGVAMGLGAPVDFSNTLLNLGIAGYGAAKHELTGSTDLPAPISNPVGGSQTFERLFQTNNDIQPTGPINRFSGRVVRDLGAAAVPVMGVAGKPSAFLPKAAPPTAILSAETQSPVAPIVLGGVLSPVASTGGEIGRSVVPEPYKDIADLSGTLVGGVAVPGFIATRLAAANALKNLNSQSSIKSFADRNVANQIESDVRGFPGAEQNLQESMQVQQGVPGFLPRVGQATGVPSLLDMERRVAESSPERFNQRAIQDRTQRQAILSEAEKKLPLLAGQDGLDGKIADVTAQRRAIAEGLPEVAADETGSTLRTVRGSLKNRYDVMAAEKFNAPVAEAERLGVKLDSTNIIDKSEKALSDPLAHFDPSNVPSIFKRISSLFEGDYQNTSFAELKAMREAVNQDIAREATSQAPEARQRLRNLIDIRGEIDKTAQQAPQSVRDLYNDATSWYRDTYAPKFLRGENLKQSMKDITGVPRIPDEKVAAQYFKPLGATPMKRFMDLYGDNAQALRAMENNILDTYRQKVVRDGFIDPKRHEAFLSNYGPALKQWPELRSRMESLANMSAELGTREEQLTTAQRVLSQGQLENLRYDNSDIPGIDPRKLDSFLRKNSDAFRESVSSIYGKDVAEQHLNDLKRISRASEIADRGRLPDSAAPNQTTDPMNMQRTIGFTGRTVFNMLRAVVGGRTSAEDMAYTLGAQAASHRLRQALIAAEERAISDPKTSQLLADAISQPMSSEKGKITLKQILAKGGLYFIGEPKYEEMSRLRAAPTAIQATTMGRQDENKGEEPAARTYLGVRPRTILSPEPQSQPVPTGILGARRG